MVCLLKRQLMVCVHMHEQLHHGLIHVSFCLDIGSLANLQY
jgi:hypothetical protein